jgi:hypothetical protein
MTKADIQILSIAKNNIKLDEMFALDPANGSSDPAVQKRAVQNLEKTLGTNAPYVTINGYNVTRFLYNFNLNLDGFLPTVRFSFAASDPVFISVNYPKDGDLVSVYMRSPEDYYKPFRMDFLVLSVTGGLSSDYSPTGIDPEGRNFRFSIIAECHIPGLYTQRIKSFSQKTSWDTLLEVSQEINLGYSSNESITNDTMSWICPNYSYYDFIQELSLRSFKDDETSFFDCWVDAYYNLNFINLGKQFEFSGNPEETAYFLPGYAEGGIKPDTAQPATPSPTVQNSPLVLTNQVGLGVTPFFIRGYTLTSRAGNNANGMGYITTIGFYDDVANADTPDQKYIKYDIESITAEVVEDNAILQKGRGRSNEYKEEKRKVWLGVLNRYADGEGVHENFLHAKYQNMINLNDCTKMCLEVSIGSYFPGIFRGQVVPVTIFVNDGGNRQQNSGNQKNGESNTTMNSTIDNFLSGNYVVTGIDVNYSTTSAGMKQTIRLSKRTWYANSSGSLPKAFPVSLPG